MRWSRVSLNISGFFIGMSGPSSAFKNLMVSSSSEILGLEWPDIDFETGQISVRRESEYLETVGIYTDDPKNTKRNTY